MSGLGDVGPGRSKRATCCQVPGCQNSIVVGRAYYRRYRICVQHTREPEVMWGGERSRCQQCARFQPIGDFDSNHRTCRVRLARHNATRHARGERGERARQQAQSHALAASIAANMQTSPHALAGMSPHQFMGAPGTLPMHAPFLPPSPFEFNAMSGAPGTMLHLPPTQQALAMLPDGTTMLPANMKPSDMMAMRTTSTGQVIIEPLMRDSRTASLDYSGACMQQGSPSFTTANGDMVVMIPNGLHLQQQSPLQKGSKVVQMAAPAAAGTDGTESEAASWSMVKVEPKASQDNQPPGAQATKLYHLAQQLLAEEEEEEAAEAAAQQPQVYLIRDSDGQRSSTPDQPVSKQQGLHPSALLAGKAANQQVSETGVLQQRTSLRVVAGGKTTERQGHTVDGSNIKQEFPAGNSHGSRTFSFQQPSAVYAQPGVCVVPAGSWGVWPNGNGQPIQVLMADPATGQSMQLVEMSQADGMQQADDASQGANPSGSNNQGDAGGMLLGGPQRAASMAINSPHLPQMGMVTQRTNSPVNTTQGHPRNSGGSPTEVANNQAASPVQAAMYGNTVYQLVSSMPNGGQGSQTMQQLVYCVQPASYELGQGMHVQQFAGNREPSAESQPQDCGTNTGDQKGVWMHEANGSPLVLTAAQSAALMGLMPPQGDSSMAAAQTASTESDYMQGSLRMLGSHLVTPSSSGILAQSLLSPVSSQVLYANGAGQHGLLAGAQLLQSKTAEAGATWA